MYEGFKIKMDIEDVRPYILEAIAKASEAWDALEEAQKAFRVAEASAYDIVQQSANMEDYEIVATIRNYERHFNNQAEAFKAWQTAKAEYFRVKPS